MRPLSILSKSNINKLTHILSNQSRFLSWTNKKYFSVKITNGNGYEDNHTDKHDDSHKPHGGGGGGGHHDHLSPSGPNINQNENSSSNPYIWDPHYNPSDESDFDRDPSTVRLREPLPKENFLPKEEVFKRIIGIVESMERAKSKGVSLTEDTHLANDLGLDSLDQVEFGLALEDEFDIEIPDEEAEQIVTLGDAVELIADHPNAR